MRKPDFKFERQVWRKGYKLVIGVDEVGRGALAGPVVAGAVQLSVFGSRFSDSSLPVVGSSETGKQKTEKLGTDNRKQRTDNRGVDWEILGIDDSKRLTAKKREELNGIIRNWALVGIGCGSVAEINRLGIVKATERAMRRAIANLKFEIRNSKLHKNPRIFVLVDAFHVKYIPGVGLKNQQAIVKGDQKVLSIAAASIIAKVYRDGVMTSLSKPLGFAQGKQSKYKKYKWDKNKGYGTAEHVAAIRKYGLVRLHRLAFVKMFV